MNSSDYYFKCAQVLDKVGKVWYNHKVLDVILRELKRTGRGELMTDIDEQLTGLIHDWFARLRGA